MAMRIIQWFLFALPLMAGTLGGVYSCADAYRDGRHFIPGMHVFKWMLYWFYVGVAILGALSVGLLVLALRYKKLKAGKSVGKAVTLLVLGLVIPAIVLCLQSPFFESGRDNAYASLDLHRLVEDCRQLDSRAKSPNESNVLDGVMIVDRIWKADYTGLPDYLQALHPLFVWKRGSLVVVQMDGGGTVMYSEGMFVDSSMSPDGFSRICRGKNMEVPEIGRASCRERV
jgi:hypothetical protein